MNLHNATMPLDAIKSASYIVDFIKEDTTPEGFDNECRKYVDYKLDLGSYTGLSSDEPWETALGAAARVGNSILIKHIVETGGSKLLHLSNNHSQTPLHATIECVNKEKGYEAMKTLLQLDAPVNIFLEGGQTPFEFALQEGNITIAARLKREGGVAREGYGNIENLEKTNELIQVQNKKATLFKLQHQRMLPDDVTHSIWSLYNKMI